MQPLSDGLYKSPLIGEADILIREGGSGTGADGSDIDQNDVERIGFRFDNPVPAVGVGAMAAMEIGWQPNDRHGFFFGFGSWEKTSYGRATGPFPIQQHYASNVINSERRGRISYTEYTLGWRYNLFRRDKFRFYSRLSFHEVFDIDYREDFVFLIVDSQIEDLPGVRRDMVAEAQTSSLFMGQIGVGGEWFLRDWLSLGLEGGYLVGQSEFNLKDVHLRDDFVSGDSLDRTGMPYRKMADGSLGYLSRDATYLELQDTTTRESYYNKLKLGFDGWRVMGRVNFYF